jgi:hypothetical protein
MQPIRAENRTAEPNMRLAEIPLATLADRIGRSPAHRAIFGRGYREKPTCD